MYPIKETTKMWNLIAKGVIAVIASWVLGLIVGKIGTVIVNKEQLQ